MGLDQAGGAIADQEGLEGTVAAHRGEIVGVQQRNIGVVDETVERDQHRHGHRA